MSRCPLILVHGVGLDRHMWDPFLDAFPDRDDAVTYDLIGMGDAPKPAGPYSLSMYSAQLAEVADAAARHGGRVDVAGFSLGALVAQRFAVDHPARIRRLFLLNSVFDRTEAERDAIRARVTEVRGGAGAYTASVEPAISRWFTPDFAAAHPDVVDSIRSRMLANEVEPYACAYSVFAEGDAEMAPLARRITAPTLVITGADDQRSTPEMTRRLAAAIPGAEAVVVPTVRHLLPVEAPGVLSELITGFDHRPKDSDD